MLAQVDSTVVLDRLEQYGGPDAVSWFEKVLGIIEGGGFVMWPLVIMGGVLWYALGVRAATLRRGSPFPLARIVRVARQSRGKGFGVIGQAAVAGCRVAATRPKHLARRLDEVFIPYEQRLKRFDALATSIVMVAPLAGLLGTVSGMIETFSALGDMALFTQSGGIAGGISQALLTTQMGLVVAIPGLLVGRILGRKARKLATELQQLKELLMITPAGEDAA